jgi:hypothetical protein
VRQTDAAGPLGLWYDRRGRHGAGPSLAPVCSHNAWEVSTAQTAISAFGLPGAGRALLLAALLLSPCNALVAQSTTGAVATSEAEIADYKRKFAVYTIARQRYEELAAVYWAATVEKRTSRSTKRRNNQPVAADDYVLTQPPVYAGPSRPVDPTSAKPPPPPRKFVPVIADFLTAAAEYFRFVPRRPRNDMEFKRAYVQVAAAAGLTRDQTVRVYAFETGGNGTYDVQSGLDSGRPGARAISTALGYNQLLTPNSIGLIAEKGEHFAKVLEAKAARLSNPEREALQRRIAALRRMIAFSRTVPFRWSEHEKLSDTPQGYAFHALNLDIDIGPLLQTQKLLNSVLFARRKGIARPLSAAELEMMNLTGDGSGYDIVSMPADLRTKVPTSNFFRRPSYERNPVAIRNNVVSKLIAATNATMDREVRLQGAKDMAALFRPPP